MTYKSTVAACYIGNFIQAIVINVTPILFIPLREQYGLSYTHFGLLVVVNFASQVLADVLFSKAVDKYGFRPFILMAHILCILGFLLFAITPVVFSDWIFAGFTAATIMFAASGGLLELLLSPIIHMLPGEQKEQAMALLHSFYCWGQIVVVSLTTVALFLHVPWWMILCGWTVVPVINFFMFLRVPICQKSADEILPIRALFCTKVFWISLGAIVFGAASEVTLSQYISTFLDQGLGLEKVWGDMLGVCGFAMAMGIGRTILGTYGNRVDLTKYMMMCSAGAAVCYCVTAVSFSPVISVISCVMSGLFVSILWPGTLVAASQQLPSAGASMFALLAAGGDIGASLGAGMTGRVVDILMSRSIPEQMALKIAIAGAAVFPVGAVVFHLLLRRLRHKNKVWEECLL